METTWYTESLYTEQVKTWNHLFTELGKLGKLESSFLPRTSLNSHTTETRHRARAALWINAYY